MIVNNLTAANQKKANTHDPSFVYDGENKIIGRRLDPKKYQARKKAKKQQRRSRKANRK